MTHYPTIKHHQTDNSTMSPTKMIRVEGSGEGMGEVLHLSKESKQITPIAPNNAKVYPVCSELH